MIPKVIHYCWFSNEEKPPLVKDCIESWKRVLPDYRIRCWGPDSFDFNSLPWTKQALKEKKWAFVADYIRLYALYTEGGVYLDSDVTICQSFDYFLKDPFFVATEISGETGINPEVAIMGSEKHDALMKECLDFYKEKFFLNADGSMNLTPMPTLIAPVFERWGYKHENSFQRLLNDGIVYPSNIFSNSYNHTLLKDNLFAIHQIAHSWCPPIKSPGQLQCERLHISWLYPFISKIKLLLKAIRIIKR